MVENNYNSKRFLSRFVLWLLSHSQLWSSDMNNFKLITQNSQGNGNLLSKFTKSHLYLNHEELSYCSVIWKN